MHRHKWLWIKENPICSCHQVPHILWPTHQSFENGHPIRLMLDLCIFKLIRNNLHTHLQGKLPLSSLNSIRVPNWWVFHNVPIFHVVSAASFLSLNQWIQTYHTVRRADCSSHAVKLIPESFNVVHSVRDDQVVFRNKSFHSWHQCPASFLLFPCLYRKNESRRTNWIFHSLCYTFVC